ncbi:SusC/RagA family TonB-linked outer membrane protein [Sphingobacterium luzhongxinii]|uniref:SusC/RagA family TonB-linked outer membrane protein n=1 Tax=Sphingobacterium luzhongxinii TaxID=2654181 RepID=UPI0013DC77CD|nr:SusC/RagA family TonB-linked outer membrane protein [Sphingobacterium sp. xlx-73]
MPVINIRILALLLFFPLLTYAQKELKGGVFDADGRILSSVTVTLLKQGDVVRTDSKGDFRIVSLHTDDTLRFTHMGFTPYAIAVSRLGSERARIILARDQRILEEVTVHTGYQALPKERATGSFSVVGEDKLNLQTSGNILERIKGMSSGLLFETNKVGMLNPIKIRGNSTINGSQDVLIVLDNFPYEGKIENINPNDIESVTILKDAAAASIWGARAGNGVIVLTSKKGKFDSSLTVNATANLLIKDKPDLFYLPRISSSDYIDVEQMLYRKGFYDYDVFLNEYTHSAFSPALDIFLLKKDGLITEQDSADRIERLKAIDSRYDLDKYNYRKAVSQQYGLDIKGGSANNAYLFGVKYDRDLTELSSKADRLNLRLNHSWKLAENLRLVLNGHYIKATSVSGRYSSESLRVSGRSVPYLQLADENGTPLPVYTSLRAGYVDTIGGGRLLDWRFFPLSDWSDNLVKSTRTEMLGSVDLGYSPIKGMNFNVIYQQQRQVEDTRHVQGIDAFYTRNLINQYSQISKEGILKYIIPVGGILNTDAQIRNSYNLRTVATYNRQGHIHSVSALAGWDIQHSAFNASSATKYGYQDDPISAVNLDYLNLYPLMSGGEGFIPANSGETRNVNRYVSVYANAAYTLHGRYTLSASARRDAANVFGLSTNDRWKPLWSTGLSWDVSKERFFDVAVINYLKLRATYGHSGNINPFKSARPVISFYNPNPRSNHYRAGRVTTLNNPSLKWEQVATLNIGADFGLLDGAITGTIDYYQKKSTDLYGLSPYNYTNWGLLATVERNVAGLEGSGMDIDLKYKRSFGALRWETGLLWNLYRDQVTDYYSPEGMVFRPTGGTVIAPIVGKPAFSLLSYKFGGLDNEGNPLGYLDGHESTDYNRIMNISPTDVDSLVYSGQASPSVFGNFSNGIRYKGWSLDINVAYKLKYYYRRSSISYDLLFSQGIGHGDFADRWQQAGDELQTSVPSMVYPNNPLRDAFYNTSEATVDRADHIRLQFVRIAYEVPQVNLGSTKIKGLQLYINASDLGILWKKTKYNLDPDYPSSLKPVRTFSMGFRASL